MMALGLSIIFFGVLLALLIRLFLKLVKRSTQFEDILESFSEDVYLFFYGMLGTILFVGVAFCVLDVAVRLYMLLAGGRV